MIFMSNAKNIVNEIKNSNRGMDKAACLKMAAALKASGYTGKITRSTQGQWGIVVKGCLARGGAVDVQRITTPAQLLGFI